MIIVGNREEMVALVGRRAMDRSEVATVRSEGEAAGANSMVCRVRAGVRYYCSGHSSVRL